MKGNRTIYRGFGFKREIIADFELVDHRENISLGKPVKILSSDLYEGEGFTVSISRILVLFLWDMGVITLIQL